jgi:signal transduction histidine kinase
MSGIRIWDSARTPGVRVTVADTGDGIPLELQKRVFEPFVSTKENTGTGLGLWVSEGIVKKHNGRIALRSSTNPARHGTVFSLLLPLTTLDN